MIYKIASRYMIKEAADAGETLGVLGKMKSKLSGAWNSTKGYANSYKDALVGKGADQARKTIYDQEKLYARAIKALRKDTEKDSETGKQVHDIFKKRTNKFKTEIDNNKRKLKQIEKRQSKAIGGTVLAAGAVGTGVYGYDKLKK